MSRILVVDDERDLAWSVCRSLSSAGHEALAALNGTDALALARRHPPDVAILDILIPGIDGLSLCRRFKQDAILAAARVLFLTAKSAVEDRVLGLQAGADDYLAKPFDLRELHARVAALLRRRQASADPPTTREVALGPLVVNGRTRAVRCGTRDLCLTPTEFDLLYHLMSYPGEVFSAQELLRVVWGYAPEAAAWDAGLVRWHIKNLRCKVEPDPAHPVYILNVPGHGYALAVRNGGSGRRGAVVPDERSARSSARPARRPPDGARPRHSLSCA